MTEGQSIARVKQSVSGLVDWLDENNKMDIIPNEVWGYIIEIEKAVGMWDDDIVELERGEDPDAEAQDYNTFGNNKI